MSVCHVVARALTRRAPQLRKEADALGKSSFAFAFYMDRQKDERERGVTIVRIVPCVAVCTCATVG